MKLFYRVQGDGPPVVLVHGGPGGSLRDLLPDLAPLASGARLIAYDQRGGGRSELPADKSLLAAKYFVDDLDAVRRFFGLKRMTLVAHSFGAVLVARYLEEHPDRVERVVLLGPMGPRASDAYEFAMELQRRLPEKERARLLEVGRRLQADGDDDRVALCREYETLERTARPDAPRPRETSCDEPAPVVEYALRYTSRLTFESFGAWDFTRTLDGVKAPLLVVSGDDDLSPLASQEAWAAAVPDGRLLVVPDAGHSPHVDRPEAVLAALRTFLDGRWPEGAVRPAPRRAPRPPR